MDHRNELLNKFSQFILSKILIVPPDPNQIFIKNNYEIKSIPILLKPVELKFNINTDEFLVRATIQDYYLNKINTKRVIIRKSSIFAIF
jgi:hypothetical protein